MRDSASIKAVSVSGAASACETFIFALGALVLVFAPLVMGGNRPLPLLGLQLAALAILVLAVWDARAEIVVVPRPLLTGLAVLVGGLLLHMLPVPVELWPELPGRADYGAGVSAVAALSGWRSLSVAPDLTEYAAWAILPPLAILVCVMKLPTLQVRWLVWVFLGMVVAQALLGLLQYGDGAGSWLHFGNPVQDRSAVGTYPNRNLLAGLLVMGLPILLALLAAGVFGLDRSTVGSRGQGKGWLKQIRAWGANESGSNRSALYAATVLVVLLGIVFTRSRSGIALAMLSLLCSIFVLGHNFGGRFSVRLLSVVMAAGLTLAIVTGLAPVLARFGTDLMQNGRWEIFQVSWHAVKLFFPLGSGAGTYPVVIAAFQPDAIRGETYINHAHNDYLEWWVEGGIVAVALTGYFLVLYLLRWRDIWAERSWKTLHMMQSGAGLGLLMMMLHGLTDFNLRIPANQIYFALLAGVFMHPGGGSGGARRSSSTGERRRSVPPESATVSSGRRHRDDQDGGDAKVPIAKPGNNPFAG